LTEPPVELAAAVFVTPGVLVNGLVTRFEPALCAKRAADLLGAEIGAQQIGDQLPVVSLREVALAA